MTNLLVVERPSLVIYAWEAEPGLPSNLTNSLGDYLPFFNSQSQGMGKSIRDVLLVRKGIAFVAPGSQELSEELVRAVELELAGLGYVVTSRLRARLLNCSLKELSIFRSWVVSALLEKCGGQQKHEPLFRRFPDGIPDDTLVLWWDKVLVHFLQAEGQPCLFCGLTGTTHVLNPCLHVVCDRCFDGGNYSACPACEHHVDRSSPFFSQVPARARPRESITFKLLDLGESEVKEVRELFASLCNRKQALSPDDRDALCVIVQEYKTEILGWLPDAIPVRENVAIVFGTLFREIGPGDVLRHARRFLKTATDVLRLIAVFSGADASLQRETVFKTVDRLVAPGAFWEKIAKLLRAAPPAPLERQVVTPQRVRRFKVAKMSRPLRRALLGLLEGLDHERLIEDMLRHRSYWVWLGEFLHPGEHAARFPKVAEAFSIVRKRYPDGSAAPKFRGWYSRLEKAFVERDVDAAITQLDERPGEFARRIDLVLRLAKDDAAATNRVMNAFKKQLPSLSTPVLLTLWSHLPTRHTRAAVRVFWPKGQIAKGVSSDDERHTLPQQAITAAVRSITEELLRRFSDKQVLAECIIDDELRTVPVPFNERTASRAAVSLPRGSQVSVPIGKTVRLFLHWCQPRGAGSTTDLDLSVALYDSAWQYLGVCSYYQLKLVGSDQKIVAISSGDLRDGPWPDGATEFVDLDVRAAAAMEARFAVMVVNNYCGMPFSLLERAYAGLMMRDDPSGAHFDPRTVEYKFAINGENGVFMPLVLDLQAGHVHWLDVQSKGQFAMNNVENSKSTISKICSELMTYFASGCRPSMYDLALLHAASRCDRVAIRGREVKHFIRQQGETNESFHSRLTIGAPDEIRETLGEAIAQPVLAALYRGNLDLPEHSCSYALFRERTIPSLSASDLLS